MACFSGGPWAPFPTISRRVRVFYLPQDSFSGEGGGEGVYVAVLPTCIKGCFPDKAKEKTPVGFLQGICVTPGCAVCELYSFAYDEKPTPSGSDARKAAWTTWAVRGYRRQLYRESLFSSLRVFW